MNNITEYRNPAAIRQMGIDALTKELGPAGMAYFIRQFDRGEGDYTAERDALLAEVTMESVLHELDEMRKQA